MAPITRRTVRQIRYKKLAFKLSSRQNHLLERCARYENTTTTKFIKQAISSRMEKHMDRIAEEDANPVDENQLALFDFSGTGAQITIWDELD